MNNIAQWDGIKWLPLGSGTGGPSPQVYVLAVYNDELIAGGSFTEAGGVPANRIARWNGIAWKPLDEGIAVGPGSPESAVVSSLGVYSGRLIVGGQFDTAGQQVSAYWAQWGCTNVTPCPGDMNCDGSVTFADIDRFVEALSTPAGATWAYACPWVSADCNHDTVVTFADIDPFVSRLGKTCGGS